MKEKEKFQSVWLTLSDGTKAGFIGKAVVFSGDKRTIVDIVFTEPKELPKNCSFGKVE